MNDDPNGPIFSVEPGNPHNDQILAMIREDLRSLLDTVIHPMVDQAEAQDADLSTMMAALVNSWLEDPISMSRERMASVMALALFLISAGEREAAGDGKTVRRGLG